VDSRNYAHFMLMPFKLTMMVARHVELSCPKNKVTNGRRYKEVETHL
jgi:hypothetical protein